MKQTPCRDLYLATTTRHRAIRSISRLIPPACMAATVLCSIGILPASADETFSSSGKGEGVSGKTEISQIARVGNQDTVRLSGRSAIWERNRAEVTPGLDLDRILKKYDLAAGQNRTGSRLSNSTTCQLGLLPISTGFALRLGAAVSPRLKFDGGVDYTIPGLRFAHGLSSRVDFDAIVDANFGGFSTLYPLTFDQIYHIPLPLGSSIYVGAGIGPYFGEVTRFGGKIVVGGNITRHFGLEGAIHFQGYGDSIATVQARIPF